MSDPAGVHITRVYVNPSRRSPSPIRSSSSAPVCTSTPINNVSASEQSSKQKMMSIAKDILASQRHSETFTRKCESPREEQYAIVSKETGQQIDLKSGDGLNKLIQPSTGTITKKKKTRQALAVVPPPLVNRSSKSSDDGDYLVPLNNDQLLTNEKRKTNFTSYDGIQTFTFTLDDD